MSNSIGLNGPLGSVVRPGDSLQIAGCISFGWNKNAVDVGSLGRIYYRGAGAEVTLLQRALVELGYARKFEYVGYFDGDVQNAVQRFQGRQRLTEDGVVGPQTWAAIALLVDLTQLANNPYIHCLPRAH